MSISKDQDAAIMEEGLKYIENQKALYDIIEKMCNVIRGMCNENVNRTELEDQLNYPISSTKEEYKLKVLRIDSFKGRDDYKKSGRILDFNDNKHAFMSYALKDKFNDVLKHLNNLGIRIMDKRSKILVTGDLNSGKSTLINAILGHDLLPSDQQPCTLIFAEIINACYNNNVEEVHCIKDSKEHHESKKACIKKDTKYLKSILENNYENFERLKIYYRFKASTSVLLDNGAVEISVIDSPGLNIDNTKTTSVFTKQEEIDAIVFVVNAENHFTLSGRQFLEAAGEEKAYIFIVVNKFDMIENKDRCKRVILEQIKAISPSTHKDTDNFVHFVSAKRKVMKEYLNDPYEAEYQKDFHRLETCLESFILEKRSRSKLAPAKIYLENLLLDLGQILDYNRLRLKEVLLKLNNTISGYVPEYEQMSSLVEEISLPMTMVSDACAEAEKIITEKLNALVLGVELIANLKWSGTLKYQVFAKSVSCLLTKAASQVMCEILEAIHPLIKKYSEYINATCIKIVKDRMAFDPKNMNRLINAINSSKHEEVSLFGISDFAFNKSNKPLMDAENVALAEIKGSFKCGRIFSEYCWSLFLVMCGAFFSRYHILRKKTALTRTPKNDIANLVIVALITTGLGAFMYKVTNTKKKIKKDVLKAVKNHLASSSYVSKTTEVILDQIRCTLYMQINHLRDLVTEIMWDYDNKIKSNKLLILRSEKYCHNIEKFSGLISQISRDLNQVQV